MEGPSHPFPPTHVDLLDRALSAVLTTHLPDGRLQSTVVWFWRDGGELLVSTMVEFRKARNMLANPRATLLVLEPDGACRWLEVRAEVRPVPGDGMADLDAAGRRYTGVAPYFGAVVPAELTEVEHPLTFRLLPTAVVAGPFPPRPRTGDAFAGGLPGWAPTREDTHLPASHHDLFDRPLLASLGTRMPNGSAQTQPVWCGRDGDVVVLATTLERRKGRNLIADPRATVLVIDPADSSRWIEVRGDVELVTDGAVEVLDRLSRAYTDAPAYYGYIGAAALAGRETRATARLHPRRVNCDAIHR